MKIVIDTSEIKNPEDFGEILREYFFTKNNMVIANISFQHQTDIRIYNGLFQTIGYVVVGIAIIK